MQCSVVDSDPHGSALKKASRIRNASAKNAPITADEVQSSVISGRCQKANVPPNASSAGVFDGSGHLQWSFKPSYWSADPRPLTLNPSFHSGRDIKRLQPVVASSFPPHPTHPTVHSEQSTPFSNKMDSATTQVNQSTFFVFNITRNELFCVLCSIWQQV